MTATAIWAATQRIIAGTNRIPVDTSGSSGPGYIQVSDIWGGVNPGPAVLSTTTGINGQTVANTALYTVPAGKTAIITAAIVRASAASAITAGPSAGVGNVAGTNNIFASAATGVTTTTSIFGFSLVGASILTVAGGTIYFNLGTSATGTSETLTVDLVGYLV